MFFVDDQGKIILSKGVAYTKSGCDKLQMSWAQVVQRIDGLMRKGRYLSPEEEAELTAKSQRLAELDAALNMEDSAKKRDERSELERPSVLADLKSKAKYIPPAKYSETREVL